MPIEFRSKNDDLVMTSSLKDLYIKIYNKKLNTSLKTLFIGKTLKI